MVRVLAVVAGSAGLFIAATASALAGTAPAPLSVVAGVPTPLLPLGGLLGIAAAAVIGGIYLTRRRD